MSARLDAANGFRGASAPGRGALLAMLAGAYALFAAAAPIERLPSMCLFRRLTGHRCPLCGLTHATRALTRGDLRGALDRHPLAPLLWIAAATALARSQAGAQI